MKRSNHDDLAALVGAVTTACAVRAVSVPTYELTYQFYLQLTAQIRRADPHELWRPSGPTTN